MNKSMLLVFCLVLIIFISGCSSAPGCNKSPFAGGCFGKTVIKNLKVDPKIECLDIGTNNCNGGILDITNQCPQDLVIGEETINSGERYVGLDLKEENGKFILIHSRGNFASYIPNETKNYEILGNIGEDTITITFQKTKRLCD